MQIIEYRSYTEVKRDMDLARELLFRIEADPQFDGTSWIKFDRSDNFGEHSFEEVAYHLELLIEAGFVRGTQDADMPAISKLTWNGHEFLDNIRDQEIWNRIKERTKGLPSVAFSVLWELAKAEMMKKLGLR